MCEVNKPDAGGRVANVISQLPQMIEGSALSGDHNIVVSTLFDDFQ